MKNRRLIMVAAMTLIAVFTVSSCRKSPGHRRPGQEGEGDRATFTENPNWNITYNGREVDVDGDGVYVVDPVYVKSSDKVSYFVDLISKAEYASAYRSKEESFIQGSFKKNFVSDWVTSGDSRTSFNALDAGEGEWVAIAYEVEGGKLGTRYAICQFRTRAITMREDKSYEIAYGGREAYRETDGSMSEVERIKVKSYSDYPYYVDIAYPEYIRDNFNGDPVAFFNSVLDGVAAGLGENEDFTGVLSSGNSDVLFDRLRHGDWTAYAFGVDNLGNLTGNWSKLNFNIQEEAASEEFRKWLGTWTIGGKATDGKSDKYYTINVRSAENNCFYTIEDWENNDDFLFETRFDGGNMVFTSQFLGSDSYDGYKNKDNETGAYDITFVGNIRYNNSTLAVDYLDGSYNIATAKLSADGTKASVEPEHISVTLEDNSKYNTVFSSMQFVDWTLDNKIAVYSENIPALPMSMTKISGPDGTKANVMGRPMPARKATGAAPRTKSGSETGTAIRSANGSAQLRSSAVPSGRTSSKAPRRTVSSADAVLNTNSVR